MLTIYYVAKFVCIFSSIIANILFFFSYKNANNEENKRKWQYIKPLLRLFESSDDNAPIIYLDDEKNLTKCVCDLMLALIHNTNWI